MSQSVKSRGFPTQGREGEGAVQDSTEGAEGGSQAEGEEGRAKTERAG
jgi:hypothetical protein